MENSNNCKIKAQDIDLFDILDFDEDSKTLSVHSRRHLIADAGFVGALHRELVRKLGWRRSRALLLRLGYASGFVDCQTARKEYSWADEGEIMKAGMEFQTMHGLARTLPTTFEFERSKGLMHFSGKWLGSLEAAWHMHFFGASPAPVCWLLNGYLTGFASAWWGEEVIVREVSCRATGKSEHCEFEARPASEWGDEAREDVDIFDDMEFKQDLTMASKDPSRRVPVEKGEREKSGDLFRKARKSGIIGRSRAVERSLRFALQVASTESTVLLSGESGTGKELFARIIHDYSGKSGGPFVAVNCGALPETLLDSELFGHRKGSFTGATDNRKGLFEAAAGGTIFLDEVAEVSPSLQVKLLRVLQDGEIRAVGGDRTVRVDVRVIAATNRDLDKLVHDGKFRDDLYYRLKVFPIEVPALRHRREDIVPLARHFLSKFSRTTGKQIETLTPEALRCLTAYGWPGNIRELGNVLERAVVLAVGDRITESDLPPEVVGVVPASSYGEPEDMLSMQEMEKKHILRVLARENGHRQKTAKALGIGVNTLWRKLREYGV